MCAVRREAGQTHCIITNLMISSFNSFPSVHGKEVDILLCSVNCDLNVGCTFVFKYLKTNWYTGHNHSSFAAEYKWSVILYLHDIFPLSGLVSFGITHIHLLCVSTTGNSHSGIRKGKQYGHFSYISQVISHTLTCFTVSPSSTKCTHCYIITPKTKPSSTNFNQLHGFLVAKPIHASQRHSQFTVLIFSLFHCSSDGSQSVKQDYSATLDVERML